MAVVAAMCLSGVAHAGTSSFTGPAMSFPAAAISVPRTSNIAIPNFDVVPTLITVALDVDHTDLNDLTFVLEHNGVSVTMMTKKCNVEKGVITLSDTGTAVATGTTNCLLNGKSVIKSEGALSGFYKATAKGTWTLKVSDYVVNSTGTVKSWTLNITYAGGDTYSWRSSAWSPWSSTCGNATRTRTATCYNETQGSTATSESSCVNLTKPEVTESSAQNSGCGHEWYALAWTTPSACGTTTRTRDFHCHLTTSPGVAVTDFSHEADLSVCDQSTKPVASEQITDYGSCSYQWQYGAWSDWSTTCGPATHTRTASCLRSDGATVVDTGSGQCSSTKLTSEGQTIVSGCSYQWFTGPWAVTPACGATDESRQVYCRRSDGTKVSDDQCTGTRPDTNRGAADGTVNYAACTFAWKTSAWSAIPAGTCGYTTRTRTISCARSDGADAAATQCPSSKPITSTRSLSYAGCGYDWRQSGYSLGKCTNHAQTYTAKYSCRRSNGTWVNASYCTSTKPSRVTTQNCGYWETHANDPYPDAVAGDAAPLVTYSPTGVTAGTEQTVVTRDPTSTEGKPGANTGGTYNPATGGYTTVNGDVLDEGYWDALTNTYWDSPELFNQWQQNKAGTLDVVIMRRVIGSPSRP